MKVFGAQSVVASAHESCPSELCKSVGTRSLGTHEPRSLQHLLNVTGVGFAGPVSQPALQAPVGCPVVGSKHGAQRSLAWHTSTGSRSFWLETCLMHVGTQRPSAFNREV